MSSFVTKHSKQRKTPKVIKIQWLESIWCRIVKNVEFYQKTFKTTQNSKSDQNTMTLHRFDVKMIKTTQNTIKLMNCIERRTKMSSFVTKHSKTPKVIKIKLRWIAWFDVELAKMSSFVTKHSKQRKTPKVIKIQWLESIWCRIGKNFEFCHKTFKTTQNYQKWSKYNDLNRFDVELAKMSSFVTKHSIQRKTPKVIKVQWLCIDLMSKWSKQRKTTKSIKLRWIALIWRRIGKNVEFCHKTFKTTQNSKSDQNTMTWIDLMSNWQKCRVLSQNIQNNAKLPKRSNYDELHAFDVELAKMSSFVTKHSKQRKTPKVIKVQWLCIDLMSKWSKQRKTTKLIKLRWIAWIWRRIGKKMSSFVTKHSKQRKTPKVIKIQWLASIWCQNDQNNAKLPNWSNYDELHGFDVELAKMSSFVTKHSKQRKTPKAIKIQWLESIWCRIGKNVEFCHKTFKTTQNSKSDQNTMTLHRFDVKMIKTTQNYQIDQITMNCMDLTSNWQKCRVLSQNIQNNAKLQKWSKYNDFASIWCQNDQNNAKLPNRSNYDELHGFDVELAKMSSFVTKHSKQRKTPKVIINTMTQNNAKLPIKLRWLHRFDVELAKMSSFVTKWKRKTRSKCRIVKNRVLSQNIQNNKTPKWSKYNDFASIWCRIGKNVSFVTKQQRKTPKVIKLQLIQKWFESIWCRIGKNVEFCHKTFKTTQNSKSDQNTMTWIDLMSNWQKCRVLSQNIQNNAKLQKWSKYNDFASIWCQNDQNNAKLPNRSNYDELHAFDVELAKMSSFVTKHSKQRKTWSKYNDLNRFDVELSKMSSKHSKQRKTPKVIKIQWLCIDLMSKWSKQRKTTKSIKLRWIALIWRRIGKNVEFCHKTFKTTQNSKSDQNTMTWIDLMSKWSKQRKTTKSIKLRWIAWIWRRIGKNVEFCHKTFKTTQNSKSDQNTMTWIASIWCRIQKCRVLSQNIQNNAKLPKWSNYDTIWRRIGMSSFVTKHSKQRKTPKVIKIQWLESICDFVWCHKWFKTTQNYQIDQITMNCMIWRRIGKNVEFCHKTFKTTQNSKSDQNTMTWIDLMSNWQKCRVLSQNIQNNAKLPKRSNYDELHAFDVELAKMSSFVTKHSKQRKTPKVIKIQWLASIWCRIGKNVEFCHKTFKTTQNYQSDQITMNCMIWRRIGKNVEFCHKTFKTTQNSKSDQNTMTLHRFDVKMIKTTQNYQIDQITMNCMDLTSNWQKCRVLSQNIQNNAKLQKWSKYNDLNRFDVELAKMSSFVKNIQNNAKLQKWSKYNDFASIWCQNDQNNAKLPKWSNYDELHGFDVELAKMSSFVTKHSKQRKTPKVIKIQWRFDVKIASIKLRLTCQKCRVLSQNIQNNAKLPKWSNYDELHRFDVELAKMSSFVTKHSKQRKTPKVIKIQWLASIWCQNDQNNAKLPNRSNYDELHRFDVELAKMSSFVTKHSKQRKTPKVIKIQWLESIWCRIGKNVEFCHKTFKTTQNSKSDQNTMTCIDLTSNWQKCRVLSQNIQNNAKLQKWSNYNELHRFDVELAKMSSFVTKHSKQRKTPKDLIKKIQNDLELHDLMSNWQKCRVLSQNIQNNAKLQKWSKYNDFASIWCQNDQNNAKLPNRSNYDELHGFDVELAKKCRVLSQNIQNNAKLQKWSKYNDLNRFDVELAKMSSFVTKHSKQRKTWSKYNEIWHSKQRKTPKVIKIQWIASIWRRIGKNVEFCHKTFKTTQNSKSDQSTMTLHRFDVKMIKTTQNYQIDQITMNCMDLTSNWQKCRVLSQNIQNNAKLQKWSKYNDLNRFDVELAKMSSFVTKHSKQRKTTKAIKLRWIAWFDVELAKMSSFVTKHSKQRKTPKVIKINDFARWQNCKIPIWCRIELAKMSSFVTKHSKQRKTPKVIKIQWLCIDLMSKWSKQRKTTKSIKLRWIAWIWRRIGKNVEFCHKTFKTTQNSKSDQNTMTWIDLMSNWQKCRVLSQNIQNNAKLQKWSKYNDFASIWCQNDQNNAKLPNRSNYDELHWFDVELAKMSSFVTKHSKQRKTPKVIKIQWLESIWCRIGKNVEFCHKTFKTTQNSKSDQITMNCMIWRRIGKNVEFCHKTFKTTQNSKSDQNTMTWIDLMSNWQKCRVLSQNIQNNAKLQKWSKYNDLHRFDVKMIKTTQNYQIDQITMNCMHLTSNWQKCRVLSQNIQNNAKLQKWSKYNDLNRFDVELAKMSSFVTKHSKQRKTPKVIKIQWLASIWCRIGKNVEFCHKTFKTTQNSKSDQSTMTLHRFDVKMIKTTQNYQIDQITMNCIDLTSNWQKCRVLSQNIQNNAKLQKWSKYNDLHRFDVELAKMSMIKTTQNYQIDQITMNCMHLTSNWQKCRVLSQNIQNNAKLQKWSKYNDLNRFDVELAKMSSFVTKHSNTTQNKTTQNYQMIKFTMNCSFVTKHLTSNCKNVEFCHKIKTTQNSKSDQNTMTCIDLMSKWSKQRKTTKSIKLRWIALIWRRIGKNVEFCHKTFKTTQNYQSDQITMNCMHLMSNWQKCRVLSQNIQNNAKLQKWSKYNDLNRFDVELAKMSSFVTKHSKQRKTPKVIKYNDFASIWCQNDQNNAKLPNRSNYDELHWFDVELAKMSSFVTKHSKQRKTPKVIKIQWLESIWCRIGKNVEFCHKTFKTTQNYQSDQITMNCMHLTSNWQKCRVLSQNIQNNAKLQKWSNTILEYDLHDLTSNWQKCRVLSQNIQNNAKLQKWSNDTMTLHRVLSKWSKQQNRFDQNYHELHRFEQRSNYDELHGFDVELAKMSSFVTKHSKQRKTPKVIKIQWLESIWCRIGKNVEFCHKTFKTTQNSKSDQNTMTCIDLMSKWSKQRKTTKSIKLRWIASIWRRIGKNVEFCHKTFKTTQNSKSDQNTMTWIDLMSNWSKQRKTTNYDELRVLSQNVMSKIQNNAKLQKWSKYNDLNRFDVELAKMSSFVTKHSKQRKTPKVIKIQWLCIDLMSKWSKQRKTTKSIKLRWIAWIWRRIGKKMSSFVTKHSKQRKTPKAIKIQWLESIWCRIVKNVEFYQKTFKTTQNSKSDQNTMTLHRFDVKMITTKNKNAKLRKTPKVIKIQWLASIWCRIGKNVEFCHKTFKTTQNYQIDQITMNCMHLTSNWQKCRVLSQNIQNNAKLQKWSKYNDLNRFDVELAKMSSFVTKHSKQCKTPKVIKIQWLE